VSKDVPIIFSGPMVRALLEGRKTMTRRLAWREKWAGPPAYRSSPWQRVIPGDRLWVRESLTRSGGYIHYAADHSIIGWEIDRAGSMGRTWPTTWKQDPRPSIHMPRAASRLTLIVTAENIERLQQITRADAILEGATSRSNCSGFQSRYDGWSMDWSEIGKFSKYAACGPGPLQEKDISLGSPETAFGAFINELHGGDRWNFPGKPTPIWDQNPFVVAISFRVIKANIDAPEAREAA
jgi:hypothetical protein